MDKENITLPAFPDSRETVEQHPKSSVDLPVMITSETSSRTRLFMERLKTSRLAGALYLTLALSPAAGCNGYEPVSHGNVSGSYLEVSSDSSDGSDPEDGEDLPYTELRFVAIVPPSGVEIDGYTTKDITGITAELKTPGNGVESVSGFIEQPGTFNMPLFFKGEIHSESTITIYIDGIRERVVSLEHTSI